MKRIAIISPCILPVPAIKGGAVEGLITKIIEDNEEYKKLNIDLFCVFDESLTEYSFENTNMIFVKTTVLQSVLDKASDAYYRRSSASGSKRLLDAEILDAFEKRIETLREAYDAIIIQNLMSTALKIVSFCQGKYEIPIYFHMHNCVDVYRSPEYIKQLVKNGVQFIAVSKYIKTEILECDKNAVVHVLYNGVDLSKCTKKDIALGTAKRYLYAGRIIPGKGVKELVTSFGRMLDRLNEDERLSYKLDIIGFLDEKTEYEKQVISLAKRYKDNICCLEKLSSENILKKYYEYDVIVMPTKDEEPFGLVALEAISRGMPLIVTDSGALPEVVGDGALIIDKNSDFVVNLEKGLIKMSEDPEYRREVAELGFKRAHEIPEFDIDNYYDGFVNIISDNRSTGLISLIVPVYNVEEYLDRCVSSLRNQTYTNLEIILIDDGSTDNSGKLCDEYAGCDSRIKVIHQKNQGLSAARNSGIDAATGDYLYFCDSDDYLQLDALEQMLSKMNRDNADIVACGIKMVGERDEVFTNSAPGTFSGHESVIQMMRSNNLCTVAWNKLYKRELFEAIRYPVGMLHEDEATTYKLLYKAKIVSYTPKLYYNYFQRSGSIMTDDVSDRNGFFLDAIEDRIRFFEDRSEKELAQHSLITLLEGIKYGYRNEKDVTKKAELKKRYNRKIHLGNAPLVFGLKKAIALVLWKYVRY